ncbi:hypothetical protein cd3_029 [Carnobacterium phage cd3]|uniref:Uncharacterized protein n=1 Tax=Carnobacterium phage cd2 TaxID=2849244 RepID=A0AAE7SNR2_9CAUD|nr:hypothetical protein PQD68_gp029 [Carnobacterium phage cd2]QXP45155.1 hypothetical protein cd2_029 [Carnobacterium phage cd2]QXP45289.1 hypothetical protein cd3_029 [Carnobacterium phage cd3]
MSLINRLLRITTIVIPTNIHKPKHSEESVYGLHHLNTSTTLG